MHGITMQKATAGPESLLCQTSVLLIDEDPLDLGYYCRILRDSGFVVKACADFGEASHILESTNFDCIIASQGGPGFEGRTVLEHSVARDRYRPVIIISRHHDVGCYLDAMQLGAVDYLEKPLTALEITHVVTTHLQPHHAAA